MTINKEALEKLIRTHGILLEHRTTQRVVEYFQNQKSSTEWHTVNEFSTGQRHFSKLLNSFVEIDSYFLFDTRYSNLQLQVGRNHNGAEDCVTYSGKNVRTVLTIECKGHPSSGFLLTRSPTIQLVDLKAKNESWQTFLSYQLNGRPISSKAVQENPFLVDWACFFKQSDSKPIKYQEDKSDRGKFYEAIAQVNRNLTFVIEDIYKQTKSNTHSYRILPLIVTNSPIYTMSMENNKVRFFEVPWVTYLSQHKAEGLTEIANPFFQFIHVVNFKHLNSFLDNILSMKNFNVPDDFINSEIHNFDIEILTNSLDDSVDD